MNLLTAAAAGAVVATFGGMAAVAGGYVGEPSLASPLWLLIVAAVVGYWVVFTRWARTN